MISLKGREESSDTLMHSRPGIDLICVIDKSSSMSGKKIELVRETLKFMLTLLNKHDRVSLVIFNQYAARLCPLTCVDENGHVQLDRTISSIVASGGTNIEEGLKAGLRVIKDRRIANQVTSVLLLSDGLDSTSIQNINALKERCQKEGITGFSVNTFGYGTCLLYTSDAADE